jgi:NADH dehydrogenase (ubiquinone) 1 alpha subcomplex subunit 13
MRCNTIRQYPTIADFILAQLKLEQPHFRSVTEEEAKQEALQPTTRCLKIYLHLAVMRLCNIRCVSLAPHSMPVIEHITIPPSNQSITSYLRPPPGSSFLPLPLCPSHRTDSSKRNLPSRGFRPSILLAGMVGIMTFGFYKVGKGIREHNELAREKMWGRIHLIPLLQAEEDRDLVRRHLADQERERTLLGGVSEVYSGGR